MTRLAETLTIITASLFITQPDITQPDTTMTQHPLRLLCLTMLAFTLLACDRSGLRDEESLRQAGAVRLDPEQVKAHVTGKTEAWRHGGGYYQADGSIRVKWLKAYQKGSWQVAEDGTLCFELPTFKRCHFYMNKDGAILMLDEGENIGERQMYDGDHLNALGRYGTGSGRKR